MIKMTRLSGEVIYLNYIQIQYLESIPETKVMMVNGDYYLVKDSVEEILQQVKVFLHACVAFKENSCKIVKGRSSANIGLLRREQHSIGGTARWI